MSELTHVELLWIKKQVENRIRFGRSVDQHIIDRHRRVVSFEAGSIFGFVRWAGNEYGTTVSRIDILRAVAPGERYITVPACLLASVHDPIHGLGIKPGCTDRS